MNRSSFSHEAAVEPYRYGEMPRGPGLALGVARQWPRGLRRGEEGKRGYFEVWMPVLAPSRELVSAYRKAGLTPAAFARRYRAEMRAPGARQCIRLLAALALRQPVRLGCFCEDETRCHRSVLKKLILDEVEALPTPAAGAGERRAYASPACLMPEIED